MAISGIGIAYATGGFVLFWSGFTGNSVKDTLTGFLKGAVPQKQAETPPTIGVNDTSSGSSGSSGSASSGNQSVPPVSGGSNEAVLKQVAASFGWTGSEWTALYHVEMAEAGFNLTAKNPSSGAYGMAQFINGPSEYAQYGGNSTSAFGQSVAMCNYIKQRYGTPSAAWAHEQANHWY
jgi:hypothetical protein